MNPEDLKCPEGSYHYFVNIVDCPEALIDRCRRCGKTLEFKKRNGNIDDRLYLLTHVRDFCQPEGATAQIFREVHGDQAVAEGRKMTAKYKTASLEESMEQGKAEVKEALKIWKRLSSKGLTEKEILKQIEDSKA